MSRRIMLGVCGNPSLLMQIDTQNNEYADYSHSEPSTGKSAVHGIEC